MNNFYAFLSRSKRARFLALAGCIGFFAQYAWAENELAPGESEYDFDLPEAAPLENARDIAQTIARYMPELHVTHKSFDDALSPAAWTNYFNAFDPGHIFFTQEDEKEFEPQRLNYLSQIAAGNVEFGQQLFQRYVQRTAERCAFVDSILSNKWDEATDETYVFRRDKLPRPANRAEQDAIWEGRIRNILLDARIACQIANQNASNRYEKTIAKANGSTNAVAERAAAFTALTNAVQTVDTAIEHTRNQIRENNEHLLTYLRDADQEMWFAKFLSAAVSAYDPHSDYLSPALAEDFQIDMQLSLQGIGAQLQSDGGTAKIVEIVPGSPSDRDTSPNRLEPGDRIIAVAQGDEEFVDIRHWPLYKAVRLIRGPIGTTVRLRVIPTAKPDGEKIVTLVRDEIKMEEQAASSQIETVTDTRGNTRTLGYIKLPAFYASMSDNGSTPRSASADVATEIAKLNEAGVEGLILDLRNNGGGSLPEAIKLAGLFIRRGPIVVVQQFGRLISLPDNDPSIAFEKPVVVLVNRLSASASEIVAAALMDYNRAIIVGDYSTHGKGSVQSMVPLDNKFGELKATTALFFRINGSSTQIKGVPTDIHLPSILEAYPDLGEDKLPGALPRKWIQPARYQAAGTYGSVIPELKERSRERTSTNTAWQARIRLIDRYHSSLTNNVKSLDYQKRFQEALENDELAEEVRKCTFGEDEADSNDFLEHADGDKDDLGKNAEQRKKKNEARLRKSDIVLDEALQILVDLIDFCPNGMKKQKDSFTNILDLFNQL